jgi:hypothetical protein
MTNNDLNEEIEQLAIEVKQRIEETESFLNGLPEFAPRSNRSKKLQRTVEKHDE